MTQYKDVEEKYQEKYKQRLKREVLVGVFLARGFPLNLVLKLMLLFV